MFNAKRHLKTVRKNEARATRDKCIIIFQNVMSSYLLTVICLVKISNIPILLAYTHRLLVSVRYISSNMYKPQVLAIFRQGLNKSL